MRISNWTKLSSEELWGAWRSQFDTDAQAETEAVWIANRLVKGHARDTKSKFYEVKDLFIRHYQPCLIEGQKVRDEIRYCNACDGFWGDDEMGDDEYYEGDCYKCEGTGIYSRRTLYLHRFEIEGRRFSFHSYMTPRSVSERPAADLEEYGGKFTEAEQADFALPMTGLLKMLRWYCFAHGFCGAGIKQTSKIQLQQQEAT